MKKLLASCFAIALTLAAAFPLYSQTPGESVYSAQCASCHGSDLSGNTSFGKKHKMPDLRSAAVQRRTDEELMKTIGHGDEHKEYPHAYLMRGMTVAQVQNVVTYMRSMAKAPTRGSK